MTKCRQFRESFQERQEAEKSQTTAVDPKTGSTQAVSSREPLTASCNKRRSGYRDESQRRDERTRGESR